MTVSIQARLLGLGLVAVLAFGLLTGGLAYRRAIHEVDELVDAQLAQYVRIMLALAHESDDDEVEPPGIEGHRYERKLLFQIWHREHGREHLLMRSPEAPTDWPAGIARQGYSEGRIGARAWRTFAAADDDEDRFALAALDLEIRDELAREIALDNLKPYLFGLPLLALVLALAIRHGLAPVRHLETELATRTPDRLDALSDAGLARELQPLVATLNQLFARLARTLDHERRFTSDAAHELRTPLAALRIQLQVAERTGDPDERHAALGKALRGADRMTHLVDQLLALARLEGDGGVGERGPVELSALVAEVAAEWVPMAAGRGIDLVVKGSPERPVLGGNPDLLRALVRNLVDNGLRYAEPGGRVEVAVEAGVGAGVRLTVRDDGPGVAPDAREHLGRRFQRLGRQGVEGVGLGLSIVQRIAELHGATVHFGAGLDGRGLGVEVSFSAT